MFVFVSVFSFVVLWFRSVILFFAFEDRFRCIEELVVGRGF